MVCDGFSTLTGSGCCSIIATDHENLQKLMPRRMLQIARTYTMNLQDLDGKTLADISRLSIQCDNKISMPLLDTTPFDTLDEQNIWKLHTMSIKSFIAEWLRGQEGKYDKQVLDYIAYYASNIGNAADITTVVGLINGLDLELMTRFQI